MNPKKSFKNKKLIVIFLHLTLIAALCYAYNTQAASNTPQTTASNAESQQEIPPIPLSDIQRFATVIAQIKHFYIKPVTYEQLFDDAIRGMLIQLDPHSSFLDNKAMKELKAATTGKFSGLGVEVLPEQDYIRIISPIDDSPAKRAGLQAGDLIIRINNKMVKKMTSSEAIHLMRGKKGSTVRLTILRKDQPKPIQISVVRDVIKIATVKSKMLEKGFGYIRIAFFHVHTQRDLKKAITTLNKQSTGKLKGVVIDLRNNPGGLLSASIQVADTFLSYPQNKYDNLIVYTKGKIPGADVKANITKATTQLQGVPLVVLINRGSASASEIVAGALQAYKRAIIVGTRSFGKGSVQTVLPTSKNTAIKLTTALYYTPSGRSIQAQGIEPDILVPYFKLPKKLLKDNGAAFSIGEDNLTGHLANGNGKHGKATQKQHANKPTSGLDLAHKDFQLFEALNVLKGVSALQKT